MSERPAGLIKPTLDKDLDKLTYVEDAAEHVVKPLIAPGYALIFLGVAMLFAGIYVFDRPGATLVIAGVALAGYMALNIGAKDVANTVGAAVGARAIGMRQALVMAAVVEVLGATIAGGPVVRTISSQIIDTSLIAQSGLLAWVMISALTAAAVWINLATWLKAPVSTTHAIVGAVIGAGIAGVGVDTIHWRTVIAISATWMLTPMIAGAIAAGFLYLIKTFIIYRDDKIRAARYWIPILTGTMAGTFASYLVMVLARAAPYSPATVLTIGITVGLLVWLMARPLVARQSVGLENKNSSLRGLFRLPLICSAALLSFAHGANDIANTVGPLSAIVRSAGTLPAGPAPFWVVLIGGCGIAVGILLFGPRLIRLVGEQITKLNPMRGYCVALSAALTVIVTSWFGMPVSSTHVAIGAVFGVGFFREWYTRNSKRRMAYMRMKAEHWDIEEQEVFNPDEISRRRLVRRSHFLTIIGAWIVTVPAAALLAAGVYSVMFALFV
ncbi:inorganic phosphate transporter [Rhizobium tumorigenes]|uniref:Phosphate transporter n=1 Tax=Rhizobium tumorigenes TaxID=2041385 RepID=A0AAF1KQP1_9HYPH|nr:inorganic phosphate transporter [Rhizobium tumorigenes]WFR95892.1 inorganic phosphate transporter [Rhizobium tumorigenes]